MKWISGFAKISKPRRNSKYFVGSRAENALRKFSVHRVTGIEGRSDSSSAGSA